MANYRGPRQKRWPGRGYYGVEKGAFSSKNVYLEVKKYLPPGEEIPDKKTIEKSLKDAGYEKVKRRIGDHSNPIWLWRVPRGDFDE